MNSYNDNLHSSVVSSLSDLELDLKKVKAQLDASQLSLYYAEGARITAAEKLEIANKNYLFQQKVQEQAVIDSDISTNVLTSANNGNAYVGKTTSNTSVAAANVQIATNAIIKLASDVGSIFSIVNAADFDTEIYQQSLEAYELMAETAYLSEKTSQHSMEATAYTSEVSAVTLADKAASTDASVKNMLTTVSGQFEAMAAIVSADNDALAAASVAEKEAEGNLEDINAAYFATLGAYNLNNKELNLNLRVDVPKEAGDRTNFTVLFNRYKSPFSNRRSLKGKTEGSNYPVDTYYIMLVKDSKKSTFSISNAEGLVSEEDSKSYIKIPAAKLDPDKQISQQVFISGLDDTDGDEMELGKNYVIFVLAMLDIDYKKAINTFDDYLTAPSAVFCLQNKISAPPADKIGIQKIESIEVSEDIEIITDDLHPDKNETKITTPKVDGETTIQKVEFEVLENMYYDVEYRCMFLPNDKNIVNGLLTVEGLRTIEKETEMLEKIADKYEPKIVELTAKENSLESQIASIEPRIEEIDAELKAKAITPAQAKKQKKALHEQEKELKAEYRKTKKELRETKADEKRDLRKLRPDTHVKPGFYFNLYTAEQVTAGGYTSVEDITRKKATDKDTGDYKHKVKVTGIVEIKPETTDNFGNRLIKGNKYIPVILALSNGTPEVDGQYTNALSDFQKTDSFPYKG